MAGDFIGNSFRVLRPGDESVRYYLRKRKSGLYICFFDTKRVIELYCNLQASPPYASATQHTFLTQAGTGIALLYGYPKIAFTLDMPIRVLLALSPFHLVDVIPGSRETTSPTDTDHSRQVCG